MTACLLLARSLSDDLDRCQCRAEIPGKQAARG